jgi:hypothetical protein
MFLENADIHLEDYTMSELGRPGSVYWKVKFVTLIAVRHVSAATSSTKLSSVKAYT